LKLVSGYPAVDLLESVSEGSDPSVTVVWQCFEAPGVAPYWVGKDAKQSAVDYAKARAKYGRGEVRVLDGNGSIEHVIAFHQRGANE